MGLGAPGETWRPHIDAWSSHFTCVAVDNRGAGRTPAGQAAPTTRDLADDVAALIGDRGWTNCRVAGISMGAGIAQELAAAHPSLVGKMALIAPWGRVDPYTASVLDILRRLRLAGDASLFNEALRNLIWTPEWINDHAEEMTEALDAPFQMSAEAFAHQVHACATHDALRELADIDVPTLVTWGEKDTFIRPELSQEVADAIPGSEVAVFKTGHVHHWEELDQFNRIVKEWMS
jgi:pimeloyl-ACP methyl ester carboxylesterase